MFFWRCANNGDDDGWKEILNKKKSVKLDSKFAKEKHVASYTVDMLSVLAETIEKIRNIGRSKKKLVFVQQYLLHEGLKIYGENGQADAKKKARQLLDRVCFKPVKKEDVTKSEQKKAQIALMYLTQKNNGVYNG